METINRGHETFLKKLRELKVSDSSYCYWLTSAALNLCVNLRDGKIQSTRLKNAPKLITEVTNGFKLMKTLLGTLSEEKKDRIEYCESHLTDSEGNCRSR